MIFNVRRNNIFFLRNMSVSFHKNIMYPHQNKSNNENNKYHTYNYPFGIIQAKNKINLRNFHNT